MHEAEAAQQQQQPEQFQQEHQGQQQQENQGQQQQEHQGQQQQEHRGQQQEHQGQQQQEQRQQVVPDVCVNETTEESQSEKQNDFIGVVERWFPSVTYPSGKEIFSFTEKDGDLSFLNYEPPSKIVKVNDSSTTDDSTPIASPLRKRVVDSMVRNSKFIFVNCKVNC